MKLPKSFRREKKGKVEQLLEEQDNYMVNVLEFTDHEEFEEFIYPEGVKSVFASKFNEVFNKICEDALERKIEWKKLRQDKEESLYEADTIIENSHQEKMLIPLSMKFIYKDILHCDAYMKIGPGSCLLRNYHFKPLKKVMEELFTEDYNRFVDKEYYHLGSMKDLLKVKKK